MYKADGSTPSPASKTDPAGSVFNLVGIAVRRILKPIHQEIGGGMRYEAIYKPTRGERREKKRVKKHFHKKQKKYVDKEE